MKNKASSPAYLIVLAALGSVLLTACGGGGGGASDPGPEPGPSTYASVSTDIFTGDTYDSTEVSIDANGDSIVRTKLAILFKPSATRTEVDALLARINATVTASIAGARSVSIRIPDPGTAADLETIIANIESEAFVEAVLKSVVVKPTALPDNVLEGITGDYDIIDNQLAVGGAAAWNAKEAIENEPNIIIMDFFGAGASQLTSFLDATILGTVESGTPNASDHGYHVAGIIAGSYGGGNSTAGLVTGMIPDQSNIHIIDISKRISDKDADVKVLLMAKGISGTVIFNTSLGNVCQSSTTSGTCRERSRAMKSGIMWADMVRAAGLESRLFHSTTAGNRDTPRYDMRDAQTRSNYSSAAIMTDMVTSDGTPAPP